MPFAYFVIEKFSMVDPIRHRYNAVEAIPVIGRSAIVDDFECIHVAMVCNVVDFIDGSHRKSSSLISDSSPNSIIPRMVARCAASIVSK